MSVDENLQLLQRAIDNWNRGDLDGYLDLYALNVRLNSVPNSFPAGVEGVRKMYQRMWSAYPGSTITVEDLFGEGDKIACR